jgi:two-component system sensor histidine kinase KdpD
LTAIHKLFHNGFSQYMISVLGITFVSALSYYAGSILSYQIVALLLLVLVSLMAITLQIKPVLCAALLSTLVLNFFFIPPTFTFHIANAEDVLLFAIYFIVALVSAVLSFKIRQAEKKARDKEEKENTIRLYNTLLNSLSHELRTPIATIIGSVDTLTTNGSNLSAENRQVLLSEIDTASIRLNAQVENLLNMSRLESGVLKLNLDWCDINELINSVIDKISTIQHTQTISFEADHSLPLFKLDAGILEQVLQNIILNAIQYTPPQSHIQLHASFQEQQCTIVIADDGDGFPSSEIPFVFNKFYRLPQTKTGGSGLGLSIAKGFIEAHRGNIKLESKQHKGAIFTITIPAETSFINKLKHE